MSFLSRGFHGSLNQYLMVVKNQQKDFDWFQNIYIGKCFKCPQTYKNNSFRGIKEIKILNYFSKNSLQNLEMYVNINRTFFGFLKMDFLLYSFNKPELLCRNIKYDLVQPYQRPLLQTVDLHGNSTWPARLIGVYDGRGCSVCDDGQRRRSGVRHGGFGVQETIGAQHHSLDL